MIQMVMTGSLSLVIGETVILLVGGFAYLYFMVKKGLWNHDPSKRTAKKDLAISAICTGIFSIVFCMMLEKKADWHYVIGASVCFFITFTAVSYAALRILVWLSGKKSDK